MTQQVQGLERTLDDSAARRIYISESFLLVDACLRIANELISDLNVFEITIAKRLDEMLPFLASEEILSKAVKSGLPREQTHHYLMTVSKEVVSDLSTGKISKNDLLSRLKSDPESPLKGIEIPENLDAKDYIGNCNTLCEEFLDSSQAKRVHSLSQEYPANIEKMSL